MNTLRLKAKALQTMSETNNSKRVSVLEAVQYVPGGEFCVVSANTGLKRPTGFRLSLETIVRNLNSVEELPIGINLQEPRIFPTS